MKALITGISGQDGSNLAEYLLSLGYEVYGTVRRHSVSANQTSRIKQLEDKITTFYADLNDTGSIRKILTEVMPDLIFNLAAQSHVQISFSVPEYTMETNAISVLALLESYKSICPRAKLYQASSSEMFGLSVEEDKSQRETTVMNPTSPYGIAKVAAYNLVRHYRRAYGLHACNGILFNHSGPRRGENFVCQKIVKTAVEIKLGITDKLELGNLDAFRDIGASKDYVRAMFAIVTHTIPDDFVVATGETHSIREICQITFNKLGLKYEDYVKINPAFLRKEELPFLRGDCSKLKNTFDWKPEYTFESMIEEMIDHWMILFQKQ